VSHLVVHPAAAFEIADAARSYDASRPGLGVAFLHKLDACLQNVYRVMHDEVQFPRLVPGESRSCTLARPTHHAASVIVCTIVHLDLPPALTEPAT
jgi:hypothetical protein